DVLAAGGILVDGRPLRFRHALVRGAVLAEMPAGEQARARAAAVRGLRKRRAPPEQIPAPPLGLDPPGAPPAAPTLVPPGPAAPGRGGPAWAAKLLERALREPLDVDRSFEALMALGACEFDLGRPDAADHFLEAARLAPDDARRTEAAIAAGHASSLDAAR